MRDILFKGKRKDNGEWVEGFYFKRDEHNHYIGDGQVPAQFFYEVIPETVGQFTGLTDKNGKEIFEGDVIEICNDNAPIKKSVAVVKFGEFKPKFFYTLFEWFYDRELKDKLHGLYLENNNGEQMFFCSTTTTIRVIGNTHDNPELLRSGNDA